MVERLTTIVGSMFCGKTEELVRQAKRESIAGKQVQIFKPIIDDRYGAVDKIKSHSGVELDAIPVSNSGEILQKLFPETQVAVIDEAQFFDMGIIDVVQELLKRDVKVYVAGLPLDFRGEPFGAMPILLAKADIIERLTAICDFQLGEGKKCGQDATRTQRFVDGKPADYDDPIVQVGGREEGYAARCPNHHEVPRNSALEGIKNG